MTCCLCPCVNAADYSPCGRATLNITIALSIITLIAVGIVAILGANNAIYLPPTCSPGALFLLIGVPGASLFIMLGVITALLSHKTTMALLCNN